MSGFIVETLAIVISSVAALVSLIAALVKVKVLNDRIKEDKLQPVTIKIGSETYNLDAPEHEAKAALERLQRRSPTRAAVR